MRDHLKELPFWESLSEDEKNRIESQSVIKNYEAGSFLHGNCDGGGSCLGMVHVISGELRAYLLSDEGREITLFRIKDNENCVLAASCILSQIHFDTQISVEKDSVVLIIPAGLYKSIMEANISVRCFTYELSTERFSTVMWVMQELLFSKFDKRLASFLLQQYETTGDLEIHMTQEQIAQDINSAREVVARMLKQFSIDGIIESKRGTIIIKDVDALRDITF